MSTGMNWQEDYYNPFGVTAESYFTKELEKLMYRIDFTEKPGENGHTKAVTHSSWASLWLVLPEKH